MTYQAYVAQKFNGDCYNVILGTNFSSVDAAYRSICNYEEVFGKCEHGYIEESGTDILTEPKKKKTLKEWFTSWFK